MKKNKKMKKFNTNDAGGIQQPATYISKYVRSKINIFVDFYIF